MQSCMGGGLKLYLCMLTVVRSSQYGMSTGFPVPLGYRSSEGGQPAKRPGATRARTLPPMTWPSAAPPTPDRHGTRTSGLRHMSMIIPRASRKYLSSSERSTAHLEVKFHCMQEVCCP